MKLRQFVYIIVFWSIIFWAGVASYARAQINPGQIGEKLIQKSVKAVLDTKDHPEWQVVHLPDSVQQVVSPKFKQLAEAPDSLYLGTVTTQNGTQWLIADRAPSKSETFTFLLFLNTQKEITGVDVLEYHENYGYEIDYSFYRDQYKGIKKADKIIFGRTIQNISGATISARSLTYAIHDLMIIVNEITFTNE